MESLMTNIASKGRKVHRIRCSEVWGGVRDIDLDISASGLTVSLYSGACDGGKGGDIYYFSVCGHDRLTRIVLADVVGHGKSVSRVSQWVYDALVRRMNSLDGSGILADLNRMTSRQGLTAMTTAAIVSFYIGDSKLYFSCAGHPPLLIRRRGHDQWREMTLESGEGPANLPLGIFNEVTYDQQQLPLLPGDRLCLYTDGLTDASDVQDAHFGQEGLLEVLDRTGHGTLLEVKNAVLDAVRGHTGGSLGHDDVTLLMIEVR